MGHYPRPGFNSVNVRCNANTFSAITGSGESNVETITCDVNGWSSPGNCVQIGCPNPRLFEKHAFFAPGLNMQHTCRSQDEINLNPEADGSNFINIADSERTNANVIVWAQGNNQNGGATANNAFITNNLDGSVATVREGARARFHCKKGFKPYYNPILAFGEDGNRLGAQEGEHFVCTCDGGTWNCNMHCRCEDYFCPT